MRWIFRAQDEETRGRLMERLAPAKPAKGTRRLELLEKRRAVRSAEERAKDAVRRRDKYQCRVPGCTFQKQGWALHVAHLDDKGMGGDKQLIRSQVDRMICLCFPHHEGPRSLHSKDLRIEPETKRGMNGGCSFWITDEQAKWQFVGVN
jgi:hypothetical protein